MGIDPSLTKSGYVLINEEGTVLDSGVMKSKPEGKTYLDEVNRIVKIVNHLFFPIVELGKEKKPDLVVIEGLAFMARNTTALVQLAGLNYHLRIKLAELDIPFVIVAPTTLKKFITGSGKGDKDMMMMKVFKDYGFESLDNNEADAYSLAVCGLAVMGKELKTNTKPQEEVVKLLTTQLCQKK